MYHASRHKSHSWFRQKVYISDIKSRAKNIFVKRYVAEHMDWTELVSKWLVCEIKYLDS